MNEKAVYEIKLKDSFSSPLKGLETKMDGFEGKVGGLKSSFMGLGNTIAGAFAGGAIVAGITSLVSGMKDLVNESIDVTRKFTNLKEAISFASGENAVGNIAYLDKEIDRLGLDVMSAYKGFKTFQGALMGTALEGKAGLEIFTALSEASTVMKLSADETEGAYLALGQMISKGNVAAEELRGQLGERLPGAFQQFAKSLGVSTKKLGDMLKAGDVEAVSALPKFAAQLRETFSPGVLDAQQSFNANMNRFNNFILKGKLAVGNALIPVLNEIVQIIPKIDFAPIISGLKGVMTPIMDLGRLLFSSIDTLSLFDSTMKGIGQTLYFMGAGPRLFVLAIKELVAVVKGSLPIFEDLSSIVMNFGMGRFDKVGESANRLKLNLFNIGDQTSKIYSDYAKKEAQLAMDVFGTKKKDESSSFAEGNYKGEKGAGKSRTVADMAAAGMEKIQAGTRNVTLNINKIIENITYEKWDASSPSKLTEAVRAAVLAAVNDVNIVAQ